MQLTAVYIAVPEGYVAFVEELPGANTQGDTLEEARENLREAVELILEANRELAAKRLAGEHFDMKSCLHELNEMAMDDPEFLTRVDALRVMVASHVREEEEDIFPAFRDGMSEAENLKLTKAINREGLKLA